MRRIAYAMLVALVTATMAVGTAFAQEGDTAATRDGNDREFASGRIIVKLEESATTGDLDRVNRGNRASTEEKVPRTRLAVVDLPAGLSVEEAVARYEASPDIEHAQPDFLYTAATTSANDPSYSKLWGLNNTGQTGGTSDADVDAPEAWDATTGAPETVVAVIDGGIDINHPDLKNNVWTNPDEVAGNGLDDDGNGYADDVHGWDFYHGDNTVFDATDGDKHGTHVAGTIAAEGNNGVGVAGVNWRARVMPLKFLGPDGGFTSDAVAAVNYALTEGVKISNNSWGGSEVDPMLLEAIKKADSGGHLFAAAAGNDTADNDTTASYPANYGAPTVKLDGGKTVPGAENVVSVAATDANDALASFSNYGSSSVDLAAPGVGINSTLPGNTYGSYSGTSMATPHVAGVAALVKSKHPDLDDAGIKAALLDSVDKKSNLSGKTVTGGRLNAAGALAAPTSVTPPSTTGDDTTAPSGTVTINGGAANTRRAAVELALSATDGTGGTGVGGMRFSDDGANWSAWEPYVASRGWTLPAGRGTKTVYAEFRDGAGNVSPRTFDSIFKKR